MSPAQPSRSRHRGGNRPPALGAGFEHRLGHFLDEQRHAVGALDDLGDHIRRQQGGIAGEPLDHRRTVAPPEPVQRHHRHMRLPGPGRLELGTEAWRPAAPAGGRPAQERGRATRARSDRSSADPRTSSAPAAAGPALRAAAAAPRTCAPSCAAGSDRAARTIAAGQRQQLGQQGDVASLGRRPRAAPPACRVLSRARRRARNRRRVRAVAITG